MATIITKTALLGFMGNEALSFADFITGRNIPVGAEDLQKQIKFLWESLDDPNIEHPLFQLMVEAIISIGILTSATRDALNAEIAANTPSYTQIQYDVSAIPRNVEDWIKALRVPSDAEYILNGSTVTITGTLPEPARRI